jgi:nucleotide-binding universal stress UspA family protein
MFSRIIVAIDLESETAPDKLLRFAGDIARTYDADVHLLHVIRAAPAIVSQYLESGYEKLASRAVEERLDTLASSLHVGAGKIGTTVRFGEIYQEILGFADRISADLIVLESHKPGVADYLLGSNAARVVRHATCSVVVLR